MKKIPIKLSEEGKRVFPKLINLKAWEMRSEGTGKKVAQNCIRVRIEKLKTVHTYSDKFWDYI